MQSIPAEKVIPGTNFTVDGFRNCSPDVQAYFLSHAHSDHYQGITDNWNQGMIHCSPVTGKLVQHLLGVKPEFVHTLAMDQVHHIQGVKVTLVDANHCPGAVQFLFELPNGEKYIHCGDMRFGQHLLQNLHLKQFQDANAVFLDTTYCNPRFTFPPQEEAVQYVANTVSRLYKEQQEQGLKRVYVISTYVIGKEKLLIAVHKMTGCKIGVTQQKMDTMKCLDLPGIDLDQIFTTDLASTPVHVAKWGFLGESWPFFRPNFVNMEQYKTDMSVDEVVGFVPTGWMYEMKRKAFPVREKGSCFIHLVPYSEHSSYSELREYVRFLRPHKVIPTVGVHDDDASGKKSASMQKHFRHLVNETASKQRFLRSLHRSSSSREGSGSLPTPNNNQPAAAVDNALIKVKSEPSDEAMPQVKEESADGIGHALAAGPEAASDAEQTWDVNVLELPDNLGLELGDAACLKADPDSLIQDALQPSDSTPLHMSENAGKGRNASKDQGVVEQFLGILGNEAEESAAREYVAKAGGNLSAAINSFYDDLAVKEEQPSTHVKSEETAQGSAPETSAKSVTQSASSAAAAADTAGVAAPQKKASQPQNGKRSTQGKKRSAGSQSGAAGASSKKPKQGPPAQRSIATFFGGRQLSNSAVQSVKVKNEQQLADVDTVPMKNGSRVPGPGAGSDSSIHSASAAEETVMASGQGVHDEPIDLVSDVKEEPMEADLSINNAAALPQMPGSAAEDNATINADGSNGNEQHGLQHNGKAVSQSLHPFFGKQQVKHPTTKSAKLPSDTGQSAQQTPSAITNTTERPVKSEQKPAAVNPFQTAQPAPEKDVPPDAVLLSTTEYDPVQMAVWEAGQATPYRHISRAFQAMESTTKRLRIGDAIANMFRSILALSPDDMLQAAWLTIGKLAPDYENVELSVGGSTVAAAVVEATGTSRAKLREMYAELGDMGDVAQACRHTQTMLHKPMPLTVPRVYKTLRQIAMEKGSGAAGRRQQAVLAMLRCCREHETKFLVRTLVSNLRVGANWRSVIGAMARAVVLHREGSRVSKARLDAAATAASEAYHVCPNLNILVPALVEGGIDELDRRCTLTPGVPLKPMLAKISEGIPDAIKQLKGAPFLAEYKYDGTRAQIHLLPDSTVKVFSRNCEDKTASMPDVVAAIQAAAKGGSTSLVLDAELVAVDRADNNRLKAFQELSTRARGEIAAHQVTMHVCVFVFDLLYVDGEALVHLPLRQRRARLAAALPNLQAGHVQFATSVEFQPAAVSAAAAAAGEGKPIETAQNNATLPTNSHGKEAAPATGVEPAADLTVGPKDDKVLGQDKAVQDAKHILATGGGDIDATGDAAAAMAAAIDKAFDGVKQQHNHSQSASQADGNGDQSAADSAPTAAAAEAVAGVSELAMQSIEDRIQEFLLESFAGGTEGLMLKALDVAAGYQPSKRSDSWIKLKRDYCEGLRDSLDLVVIGAWQGQGRKVKWFSPFLLAAYDPDTEEYQSVCRCMSGYTDAFYAEATTRFKEVALPGKPSYYRTDESPDFWFPPTEVWEIRGADLTVSPVHKAAVGHIHPDRGISLRFPRYITSREDRRPEDASNPEVIVDLYNKQNRRMANAAEMLANKTKAKPGVKAAEGTVSDEEEEDDDNADN